MELKDFISETLVEIVEALHDAQLKLKDRDAVISPSIRAGDQLPNDFGASPYVERINFDVAVTAAEQTDAGLKTGISVLGAKLGGEGSSSQQSQSVSRIQFSVPVIFPQNRFQTPLNWRDEGKPKSRGTVRGAYDID